MHSQEFIQKMKNRLVEEKARLTEEMNGLATHTEMGDDQEDNASEYEVDEVSHDIKEQLQSDIQKIDAAMERIEKGTYGVDTNTGQDIPAARLEVIPWAETAVENEGV